MAPRHEDASPRARDQPRERLVLVIATGLLATRAEAGADVGPSVRARGVGALQRRRPVGEQGLPQGEVEVDRAGPSLEGEPVRPTGECPDPAQLRRPGAGGRDLDEPLRRRAEQVQLVDRLSGSVVAQLRRPVGREQQQRHTCLPRLDHGGQQLGGGRARGAGDGHRQPRRLRQAEGEEARAALIDVGEAAQAELAGERQHERGVARARRGARARHAAAPELLGEGAQQQVGVGCGAHTI